MSPDDLTSQPTQKRQRYVLLPLADETQRAHQLFNHLHEVSTQSLNQGYLASGCYLASIALRGAQLLLDSNNDIALTTWNEQASNLVARLEQLPSLKGVHIDVC